MTRRKKLLFAAAAMLLASGVATVGLLAVDIYLHGKYERSAGYNIWGYRGPRVGSKKPNEIRVAVLGGSTAFGYGVTWEESIPALLEQKLSTPAQPVSVVNLGYNNEGAYSLRFTLDDYRWLDYDLAILYDGYNDLGYNAPDMNRQVYRRDSPLFRWTGYLPIFPIIFQEKAAALLSGGDVSGAYSKEKTVFRPGLAARGAAGVLGAAAGAGAALQEGLNSVATPTHMGEAIRQASDCETPWQIYCESVAAAIAHARQIGVDVMFVGQPASLYPTQIKRHPHQQAQVAQMIARRFGQDPRVRYASMADAVDLANEQLSFDGMHLTADGNRIVAERMAAVVREFGLRRTR
ncbi:MAG TPA: hypothetical protein VNT81_08855 [Vicinamibacterales bacterium]|nr:hypothetical protein [Vicinamibacterales bacterium]